MSLVICPTCTHEHEWRWDEAFEKFGFCDGDGIVLTDAVVEALTDAGYVVASEPWGIHNVTITSIKRDGVEQIPTTITLGYDDPRDYLPQEIIAILDKVFPEDRVMEVLL